MSHADNWHGQGTTIRNATGWAVPLEPLRHGPSPNTGPTPTPDTYLRDGHLDVIATCNICVVPVPQPQIGHTLPNCPNPNQHSRRRRRSG